MPTDSPLLTELKEPREILESLTPKESDQLLALMRQAMRDQQRSLDAAIDQGLQILPRLARIPARRILFGK
ncbi:hypothetical protein ACQPW1_09205 [Nocardia sp. CA-128927]|uniref:hypothetical protein n=1 Tax=Nocardia sp. CA-128927 TaxID=3239975 RepID=UPI003D9595D0